MAINLLGQRDLRRHQERRPIDGVEANDILADEVDIGRPIAVEQFAAVGITKPRQIVGQRVEPDIHDMVVAARNLDPPVEAGPRNRQIVEPALDEAEDFIAAAVGLDEFGVRGIMVEQSLLIGRQLEKPALLDGPFDRRSLRRAALLALPGQFARVVKRLVADRIPAFVAAEIEVAIGFHRLPDRLARAVMIGLRGADETII